MWVCVCMHARTHTHAHMFHDTHVEVRGTTNNPKVSVFSFRPVGPGDHSGWQAWQQEHSLHLLSLLQLFWFTSLSSKMTPKLSCAESCCVYWNLSSGVFSLGVFEAVAILCINLMHTVDCTVQSSPTPSIGIHFQHRPDKRFSLLDARGCFESTKKPLFNGRNCSGMNCLLCGSQKFN